MNQGSYRMHVSILRRHHLALFALVGLGWLTVAAVSAQPTQLPVVTPKSQDPVTTESWYVTYVGNARTSYEREKITEFTQRGQSEFLIEHEEHMAVKRLGKEIKLDLLLTVREAWDGSLLAYDLKIENPPHQAATSQGRINRGQFQLQTQLAGRVSNRNIEIPSNVVSSLYVNRWINSHPMKSGETKDFQIFKFESQTIDRVKISCMGKQIIKLHGGIEQQLNCLRLTYDSTPNRRLVYYVHEHGDILKIEDDNIGGNSISYKVPREIALQELSGAELDLTISSMYTPEKPIPDAHQSRLITYRISHPELLVSWHVSPSANQELSQIDPHTIEIKASLIKLPHNAMPDTEKKDCLNPSMLLQIDDPQVVRLAQLSSGQSNGPARIATEMEAYLAKRILKDELSSNMLSAAEVAKTMKGDCTEHAVLLCAMLRARKIPARIAIGLVYVENLNAFVGHMWTEVWLSGQWYGLDATQGRAGISAGYLKIADSELSEDAPIPTSLLTPLMNVPRNLRIQVIQQKP
jgi:hypothetical protein